VGGNDGNGKRKTRIVIRGKEEWGRGGRLASTNRSLVHF
jgi:hypothetical protein